MRAGFGAIGAILLAVLLLPIPVGPAGAKGTGPGSLPTSALGLAPSGNCSGPSVPVSYSGRVEALGALPPTPSVANVSVKITYQYQMRFVPNNGSSTTTCPTGAGTNATNGTGGFTLAAGVPASSCSRVSCTYYSGPFGPVSFSDANPPPAGYFVTTSLQGTRATVALVAALSSVSLSPWGRTTVSVLAPTNVLAHPTAGNGAVSPATISFAWTLSGVGWSVLSGAGTGNLSVEAQTGSGLGSLELWTNGTYGSGGFSVPPVTLELIAVPTDFTSGDLTPTALDAGAPATFTLRGTGSGGYTYSATILPGLEAPSVSVPCSSASTLGGTVSLTCIGLVTYATAGDAQPSANLTNGYSTAYHAFSQVHVAPRLGVAVSPDPAVAYVGSTVDFALSVATNSGTGPFGPACLSAGNGALNCTLAPGPSWSFGAVYSVPGTYSVRATVADAAGSNATASTLAQLFERPSLAPIVPSTNDVTAGNTVSANALLSGGAWNAGYWWNDSLPNGTISSGVLGQDGVVNVAFTAVTPGAHQVTLTVKDSLGTIVARSFSLTVEAGPTTAIVPTGAPPSVSVVAGTPWVTSWTAVDARGVRVLTNPPMVELSLSSGPGDAVWVNASDGPHRLLSSAPVNLSASAWDRGYLNLSVTSLVAGPLVIGLRSTVAFVVPVAGLLTVSVGPDVDHLALGHPNVVRAGARSNETLWQIADRFGNPVPDGYIVVRMAFGSSVTNSDSPIRFDGNRSTVWVNYTAPSDSAGTVYVLSASDQELLPPLLVPSVATPFLSTSALLLIAGAAIAVAAAFAVGWVRSRRRLGALGESRDEVGEEDLRRLAEGRAHVLRRARAAGPLTIEQLEEGFDGPRPSRGELAEWIASLVSEGVIAISHRPDGAPRYAAVERPEPVSPRVRVDPELLEAALARRPGEVDDDDPDPADEGTPE